MYIFLFMWHKENALADLKKKKKHLTIVFIFLRNRIYFTGSYFVGNWDVYKSLSSVQSFFKELPYLFYLFKCVFSCFHVFLRPERSKDDLSLLLSNAVHQ